MVMLRSLAENNGEFAAHHYQKVFKLYFGPGGRFVGYIDNATRITLQNLARIEGEAVAAALTAAPQLSDETRNKLIGQVLPYCRIYSGQALRAPVERDIRMTGGDDQMVEIMWDIVRVVDVISFVITSHRKTHHLAGPGKRNADALHFGPIAFSLERPGACSQDISRIGPPSRIPTRVRRDADLGSGHKIEGPRAFQKSPERDHQ